MWASIIKIDAFLNLKQSILNNRVKNKYTLKHYLQQIIYYILLHSKNCNKKQDFNRLRTYSVVCYNKYIINLRKR